MLVPPKRGGSNPTSISELQDVGMSRLTFQIVVVYTSFSSEMVLRSYHKSHNEPDEPFLLNSEQGPGERRRILGRRRQSRDDPNELKASAVIHTPRRCR